MISSNAKDVRERLTYIIDTNVLVDYVDIIPSLSDPERQPTNPTVDLARTHIVIPTAVIRELSSFKKEKTERGKSARVVLKRLRALFEGKVRPMGDVYVLGTAASIEVGGKIFSILPIHKNFKRALPFNPSDDDMDGQIILAGLTVSFLKKGWPIDGTAEADEVLSLDTSGITILTNDNGLAIRARERGLLTMRYGHKYPEPYTGRREIVVPVELFKEFYNGQRVERAFFEKMMPDEEPLVANEFIVFKLANPEEYPRDFNPDGAPYFEHIGRYDRQEEAIVPLKYVSSFPVSVRNVGQAIYAEALMNPDFAAVICTGPAGSGKTYMATVYGYDACRNGQYIGVTVVPCENHGNLGALPGDLDDKMDPDVQPFKNALRNYLLKENSKLSRELERLQKFGASDKAKNGGCDCADDDEKPSKRSLKQKLDDHVGLIWENWFSNIPIWNARGRDFSYELALYDEFQDQTTSQADTLIKRIGSNGKIVITGDIWQIHAPYLDVSNNGLIYASAQLFDHPLVAQVCFTEDEVIRHPLVREIARRQKMQNQPKEISGSYPPP